MNQVGCVYTAQGFEFDYVGVVWGRDLRWDPATNDWRGDPSHSHDAIVKRSGDRFHGPRQAHLPRPPHPRPHRCYLYFEQDATCHRARRQISGERLSFRSART